MEEWSFVGELELEGWKGSRICLTCQNFTNGLDAPCVVNCVVIQDHNTT